MKKTGRIVVLVLTIVIIALLAQYGLLSKRYIYGANSNEESAMDTEHDLDNPANIQEIIREKLSNAIALYVGSPKVFVNNKEVQIDASNSEVTPIVTEGRTLVPVRFISESLGATVKWNDVTSEIAITYGRNIIKLTVGSREMTVNNKNTSLDVPAEISSGRTLIPLRSLAEALGKKVFYDRGLIVISDKDNLFKPEKDKNILDEIIANINSLPTVGTYEQFKTLLEQAQQGDTVYNEKMKVLRQAEFQTAAKAGVPRAPQAAAVTRDEAERGGKESYSTTNVQVQGVDEADIVKTDGEYIYYVNRQKIIIAKAYPADSMKVVSTLDFNDGVFMPKEIYIDGQYLTVIGTSWFTTPIYDSAREPQAKLYRPRGITTVKAAIYDTEDKANVKKIREIELEGSYVTSRKIGSSLYLLANKYVDYVYIQKESEGAVPFYRDTASGDERQFIDYSSICYLPKFMVPNYMIIASLNLDCMDEEINISTYLGAGENVYVSDQNMYVAVTRRAHREAEISLSKKAGIAPIHGYDTDTLVYKFSLHNGKITYLNKGIVPGTILNQFSMDEYKQNFRIATTSGDMWRNDEFTSKNNVYILDSTMSIAGKLEDIAPGEKIYSVRFMGNRGYMVTFKTVDPLFVIDLKNPHKPDILGSLKIPGYSDYIHPYDENHIIGFGKDTIEMPRKDHLGRVVDTTAYYLGMKMAVYDVSDVSHPVEKFVEKIGDRGTESELLRNHKALLFSKEKNLLAFPVTVMETDSGSTDGSNKILEYGQFAFQGAYVYNVDLDKGFSLKGKITHLTDSDYKKSGNYWYQSDKNIERIMYIDNTLYTLSGSVMQAHELENLKLQGVLDIN